MKSKYVGIISIVTIATAATYLIIKKILSKRKEEALKEAKRLYKEKKYEEALKVYRDLKSTSTEALNGMAMCLIKLKQYDKALAPLNESLEDPSKDNHKAIQWRAECYRKLGNKRMCYKDLNLLAAVTNAQDQSLDTLRSIIVEEDTTNFVCHNLLPPSNTRFSEYFEAFEGVLKGDRLSLAIKGGNWENLNLMEGENIEGGNELLTKEVFKSSLLYLKYFFKEAVDCLSPPANPLESLLIEYFSFYAFQRPPNLKLFDKEQIQKEGNPTLIFLLAKLSLLASQQKTFLSLLKSILHFTFAKREFILFYKGAVKGFEHPLVHPLKAEEALKKGDHSLVLSILPLLDKEDPKALLLRAEYAYSLNDFKASVALLKMVLRKDPTSFKAYFYLGEILSQLNPTESKSIWEEVLSKASRCGEVRVVMLVLLCLEVKGYVAG